MIVTRRILWVLSCWSYLISPEILPDVLELIRSVIDPSNANSDVVTKYQATVTLKSVIETENFKSSMLINLYPAFVQSLCQLTLNLEECENRSSVVNLIGDIVYIMGCRVRTMLQPIASHLCALWKDCEPTSPVKSSILDTLARLIKASGRTSDVLHPALFSLIADVLGHEGAFFARKEACSLWLALIRDTSVYSVDLDNFFKM